MPTGAPEALSGMPANGGQNKAATGSLRRRLVSAAGWTGGHPAVFM